ALRARVQAARLRTDPERALAHDRVRFDLDEHRRIDQAADLDHASRRADVAEELAVRAADLLPFGDVRDVHARADDVLPRRTGALERRLDVAQRLDRLRVRVAGADELAVRVGGGRPRHVDVRADADRAGVA